MKKYVVFVLTMIILNVTNLESLQTIRNKRDDSGGLLGGGGGLLGGNGNGGLLDSLTQVVQQLKDTFLGGQKQGALNDAFVPNSQVGGDTYKGPSILQAIGFCNMNSIDCDFIGCLATNFKNSKMAQSIKKGGKVLLDPGLRRALLDDPAIMKAACESQEMSEFMCNAFKQFLGLFERIDPPSAHVHDEPRDKRAAALLPPSPSVVVQVIPAPAPVPAPARVPAPAPAPAPALAPPPTRAATSVAVAPSVPAASVPSGPSLPLRADGTSNGNGFGRAKVNDQSSSGGIPASSSSAGGSSGGVGASASENKNSGRDKSHEKHGGGQSPNKGGHGGDDYYDQDTHPPKGVTGIPGGGEGGDNSQRNCKAERQAAVAQRDAVKAAAAVPAG